MIPIFIETYGCTLNQSDSELMEGLLIESGYEIVDSPDEAALIIINTCTVKTPTENNLYKRLDELVGLKKPFVIAGCIPQVDAKRLSDHLDNTTFSLIGTHQITNIVEVVQGTIDGNNIILLAEENTKRLNLVTPKKSLIGILPISKGCLGSCTYCQTKTARGKLHSYQPHEIVRQASRYIQNGAKEIWVTSQDTAAYGKDIGKDLCELLREILDLEGNFFVRLGMANPNHVISMQDELIKIFNHPKMFKFLHVPLQSGDDEILEKMGREYKVAQFKQIVNGFRSTLPDITIATDMICGFPGETDEHFANSIELLKEIKPAVVNISRFWARPNTPAFGFDDQVHGKVSKERSRQMTSLFRNISLLNNESWIGWEGDMIIESGEEGSRFGRNIFYKPISVHSNKPEGTVLRVKVENAKTFHLVAKQKNI